MNQVCFYITWMTDGSGLFQQENVNSAKSIQEWFEEHDKDFKVLPRPSNPPDFNLIKHVWDKYGSVWDSDDNPKQKY